MSNAMPALIQRALLTLDGITADSSYEESADIYSVAEKLVKPCAEKGYLGPRAERRWRFFLGTVRKTDKYDNNDRDKALDKLFYAIGRQYNWPSVVTTPTVAATGDSQTPTPIPYLFSWREILDALRRKNNKSDQALLKKLNEKYDGPIKMPVSRGAQPCVDKNALIEWWNGLHDLLAAKEQRTSDKNATVARTHSYGANGTVVPDLNGSVRLRRQ